MEYQNDEIMNAYRNLPQILKEAIFSVDTTQAIQDIGTKYKLTVEKSSDLMNETILVMLGLTHPNQFIANLAERLEIDKETARQIAEEINSKIFFPIRETLKQIHKIEEETFTPEIDTKPTEPAPVVVPESPFSIGGATPASAPETPAPALSDAAPAAPPPVIVMPAGADLTESLDFARDKSAEEIAAPESLPPDIFETKTRDEIFRSPMEVSEKRLGPPAKPPPPPPPPPAPKADPYREAIN